MEAEDLAVLDGVAATSVSSSRFSGRLVQPTEELSCTTGLLM